MRTKEQYLADLAKMRPNVYLDGKLVGRDDPRIVRATYALCATFDHYDSQDDPEIAELITAKSHINGKKICRYNHINQCPEDLLKKQKLTRLLARKVGCCIQRCMGVDVINAISVVSKNTDIKYGTSYYENFLKFLEYFQENDLVAACGQTDPKGDRSKRPAQQWDPDQYLHVVERRPDGVVVRGCKVHNSIAPFCDEIIVVPTRALKPEEKDWAIAFAIPADTKGLYLIGKEAGVPIREKNMYAPITDILDIESMTVFDDVFIPNERIFLNGETDMAGKMALTFALYHRHSYTGCKPGATDVLLGSTALMADYNNIAKQSHVRQKLVELISIAELVFAAGIAGAVNSHKAASGTQVPEVTFINVGRRHAGHNLYHEYNLLCEVAGGLACTLPNSASYNSPEVGDYVRKYVTRREGVSPENCYRAFHAAMDILTSEYYTLAQVGGVHGGGSPIMEDIAIMGNYDLQPQIENMKRLAGIQDD